MSFSYGDSGVGGGGRAHLGFGYPLQNRPQKLWPVLCLTDSPLSDGGTSFSCNSLRGDQCQHLWSARTPHVCVWGHDYPNPQPIYFLK